MYKYMEMRPEKVVKKAKTEEDFGEDMDDDFSVEDPELEKFADEEMQREMKRMAQGAPGGMPDTSEEEISMEGASDDDAEDGESDLDGGDEDGFFSGEDDLQDVEIDKDDDDEDEGEDLESYGSMGAEEDDDDDDDQINDGSDIPSEEEKVG